MATEEPSPARRSGLQRSLSLSVSLLFSFRLSLLHILQVSGVPLTQHAAGRLAAGRPSPAALLGHAGGRVREDSEGAEITGWRLGVALLHNHWVGPVARAISTTFPAPTHI